MKNEHSLERRIAALLRERPDIWHMKVHGGPYQRAGVWDRLYCVRGRFGATEQKHPDGSSGLSASQEREGERMAAAGATLKVVRSLAELEEFLRDMDLR